MNVYETGCLKEKLSTNTYPGRGIVWESLPMASILWQRIL